MASYTPRDLIVRFLADVNGFLRGTDQVADALADTARDQETLADQGEETARRLARAYDKAGQEIRRDADRTKRDTKRAYADTGREVGQEFAQNIGEGISSGGGDVKGAVLGTLGGVLPALGPWAAAAGVGAVVAQAVFGNIDAMRARAKEAGRQAFDALRDGMVEGSENESIIAAALGMESFDDVVAVAIQEAARLKVPAGQVVTYYRTAGKVIGPELRAAFRDAERAGTSANRGMQGAMAETLAATKEIGQNAALVGDAYDVGKQRVDVLNDSLAQTVALSRKAAYYADKASSSYALGGSTAQQQLGAAGRYVKGGRG